MLTEITELKERRRVKGLLVADWTDALFVHFAVDPADLGPLIPRPLELDCRNGEAFISLVAFTQRRLRPTIGGRFTAFLSRPLAEHHFLNVRTYVHHAGEPGIFFLAEWIPNRLACFLGPLLYGLPYRLGTLNYLRGEERVDVRVSSEARELHITAALGRADEPRPAEADTLDEFLVERYTAFTVRRDALYCFRIEHQPWPLRPATGEMKQMNLLNDMGFLLSTPTASHFSAGIHNVQISGPRRLQTIH